MYSYIYHLKYLHIAKTVSVWSYYISLHVWVISEYQISLDMFMVKCKASVSLEIFYVLYITVFLNIYLNFSVQCSFKYTQYA